MPWDPAKCPNGGPDPFDPAAAVNAADFSDPVFVQISDKEKVTKKVYTYYVVGGFRICVVADVHRKNLTSPWNIAGNCFIPGWQNWQMTTPAAIVAVAGAEDPQGAFPPGNDRYPTPDPGLDVN